MADEATWLGPARPQLAEQIQARFGLGAGPASRHAARIADLAPRLRPAFEAFWTSGSPDEAIQVGAYSLGALMKDWGMSPLAAFSALDWLIRDPAEADKALKAGIHGMSPARRS